MKTKSQEILDFWFSPEVRSLWFNSTPEFDGQIKAQYEKLFDSAIKGELSHWEESAEGALAVVIILDQFPLNMFRDLPRSFSGEAAAIEAARKAIDKGFDEKLNDEMKAFLYLPFMHSENLDDQDYSLSLFVKASLDNNLKWARHHREIVRKFGRFPHRNHILDRKSSKEELDYLESDDAYNG